MHIGINDLPRPVLEHIFFYLRPYDSLNNARQVSNRWRHIVDGSVKYMKRRYSSCVDLAWHELREKLDAQSYICERGGHAACYSKSDNCLYMFGGSTARHTPLADMWRLKMDTLEWFRVNQKGDVPYPRSLCTLLDCDNILVLFGGYSKSSMNPIHQHVQFFCDLYFFIKQKETWVKMGCNGSYVPQLASHGATILQDRWMVISFGSSGDDFSDKVFIFDLVNHTWHMVECIGPEPLPRHGHCQILIDDFTLLIVGGAGVIKGACNDAYLLTFNRDMIHAEWKRVRVENKELWPSNFWGIRGTKIHNKVVFLAKPSYIHPACYSRPSLRTTSSFTSSSSSSQSRISSPDSLQDRRAVAAAFSKASRSERLSASAAFRRKSQLLTSKSLDEQNNDNGSDCAVNKLNYQEQSLSAHKYVELQRACSIPAIIVGEIPKLIITDDLCSPKASHLNGYGEKTISTESFQINDTHINSVLPLAHNEDWSDLNERLCVFVLDISRLRNERCVRWEQNMVECDAPPVLLLYSLVNANGELIVFGGMKTPSATNPFLNVNFPNEPGYATNSTYLLRPNYFQQ